jgi:sugar transferase (PEP-CTERM system associated)
MFHAYFPARTVLLAASEAFLILLALVTATVVWRGADSHLVLIYENGWLKIAVMTLVCLLCMYYYDLYDSVVRSSSREVVTRLVQVWGTACLILALLYYIFPQIHLGLPILVSGIFLTGVSLPAWRKLFLVLSSSPRLAERALVLGEGPLATCLTAEIGNRPELGLHLLGYVGCTHEPTCAINGLRCLGRLEELPTVVERERVNRIIVGMGDRRGRLPVAELLRLKTHGVQVDDGADFYEIVTGKVPLVSLHPGRLLFSDGFGVSRPLLVYKRVFSIVLSLLGLLVSLPLMGVIALAIWLESGRPVLFRQERIGKDGKSFTLYKFRSMWNGVNSTDKVKPAQENDERFTRVGRWVRRTRLDELPQLYNLLRGDMYLVGPRPFAREEEEELARQIPFYTQRWTVKPGATGWAQIHRGYCASIEDNLEKLAYDLFYVKNMSVGLDLLVLFQTVKILLLGRGAR